MPKARKASKASKASRKPARKPAHKPAKTQRTVSKPAKRASPAPKGVQVKRPPVLRTGNSGNAGADAPAFEVRLDASQQAKTSSPMAAAAKAATTVAPPSAGGLTYAQTGVDIHREDKAIEALAGMVNFQRQGFGAPLGRIGHFAGLVDFGPEHALVLCTDGVGSKVEIANAIRKWDT
ncbi:MAG TPA: hypothetical protein VM327_07670, partial [Candidatus Thermoplasmatota archaeon]|nr:hypothetical protein [Candidatus Thermoplasmatota archaeon]